MGIRNLFTSLIIAGSLIGCGELETQVKTFTSVRGNSITIKRIEVKGKTMFDIQREVIAKHSSDDPENKYLNHEYYPILEIRVRFPLDRNKNIVQYLDDKYERPGTAIVDAYWDGREWIQRSPENEELFLKYDKEFLELRDLLNVDEIVKKY